MIRRGRHDVSQSFHDAWDSRDLGNSAASSAEVRELVALAERIAFSVQAEPSPQFRSQLRERVMLEAAALDFAPTPVAVAAPPAPIPSPRRTHTPRRRLAQLATAAVAVIGIAGTAVASSHAVPGYALYPVKRGVENIQLAMQDQGVDRGDYQLQRAEQRLAEAVTLQAKGNDAKLVTASLEDFSDQAKLGAGELLDSYVENQSSKTMQTIDGFVAESTGTLQKLASNIPSEAKPALAKATEQVEEVASRAADLCKICSPEDVPNLVSSQGPLGSTTDGSRPSTAPSDGAQSGSKRGSGAEDNTPEKGPAENGAAPSPGQLPDSRLPGGQPPSQPHIVVPTQEPPAPQETPPSVTTREPSGGLLGRNGLIPGLVGVLTGGL